MDFMHPQRRAAFFKCQKNVWILGIVILSDTTRLVKTDTANFLL